MPSSVPLNFHGRIGVVWLPRQSPLFSFCFLLNIYDKKWNRTKMSGIDCLTSYCSALCWQFDVLQGTIMTTRTSHRCEWSLFCQKHPLTFPTSSIRFCGRILLVDLVGKRRHRLRKNDKVFQRRTNYSCCQ